MKKITKSLFLLGAVCALTGCNSSSATLSVSYKIASGFARDAVNMFDNSIGFIPTAITANCNYSYDWKDFDGDREEVHSSEKFIYSEKDAAFRLITTEKTVYVTDGIKTSRERHTDSVMFYDSKIGIVDAVTVEGDDVFTPNYYIIAATKEEIVDEMNSINYQGSLNDFIKETINELAFSKFESEKYEFNRYSDVSALSHGDSEEMFLSYFFPGMLGDDYDIDYRLNGDNLFITGSTTAVNEDKYPGATSSNENMKVSLKLQGMYATEYSCEYNEKGVLYVGNDMEKVENYCKEETKSSIKFEGRVKVPNLKDYVLFK